LVEPHQNNFVGALNMKWAMLQKILIF